MEKLVLEDNEGKTLRAFVWSGEPVHVIRRGDTRRLELVPSTDWLAKKKIPFENLSTLTRESLADDSRLLVGELGHLRLIESVGEVMADQKDHEENRRAWYAALLLLLIGVGGLLVLFQSAPTTSPKMEEELKQQIVKIVKSIVKPPPQQAINKPTEQKEPEPVKTVKPQSLKRLGALSALGALSNSKQRAGLNLQAAQTTAGPGLGGTAGSGGTQTSLYAKGIVSAPLGAGANVQGAGGYGTHGKGGGQAGYSKLALTGSTGVSAIPLGAEASVAKGLDRDQIAAVINRNQGQIRFCYEQGLQGDPTLNGRVAVDFTISGQGMVSAASVANTTLNAKAVEDCILMRLKTWKFPLPEGGVEVKVNYPFNLRRSGQGVRTMNMNFCKWMIVPAVLVAATSCGLHQNPLSGRSDAVLNAAPPGQVQKPTDPTSSEAVRVDGPDVYSFMEERQDSVIVQLHVLKGNYNGVLSIGNPDLFPGSTFDPTTGTFTWTPVKGTVVDGAYRELDLKINGTAQPTDPALPQLIGSKMIHLVVNRKMEIPEIVSVTNNNNYVREGADYYFTVIVQDPDGGTGTGQAPVLTLLPPDQTSYIKRSFAPFVTVASVDNDPTTQRWTFQMKLSLTNQEVTPSSDTGGFKIRVVNRFNQMSADSPISFKVYTRLSNLQTSWTAPMTVTAGQANSLTFLVFDTKGEAVIDYLSTDGLPSSASINCPTAKIGVMSCTLTWTPDANMGGGYEDLTLYARGRNQDSSDNQVVNGRFPMHLNILAAVNPGPTPTPTPIPIVINPTPTPPPPVPAPAPLNPDEAMRLEGPDLYSFQQGHLASMVFQLHVPNSAYKGTLSIDNLNSFPGATFDATTGTFSWNPAKGTVLNGKTRTMDLIVKGLAQSMDSELPPLLVTKTVHLLVNR